MGDEQKEIVRLESFWINAWLKKHYKGLETRFIIHDAAAKEVSEDVFFRTSESGGTLISSAYKLCQQMIEADYPVHEWNIYPFHFSDGDNWSGEDTKLCVKILKDFFLPSCNQFCYGQVESKYGSGQFFKDLQREFPGDERIVLSQIESKEKILDNNKNIRGINELYVNTIYATTFGIYDNLILDRDTFNYSLLLANRYGKCLKLQNDTNFTLFDMETNGILKIYNNQNIIEIIGDNNNNIIYPLQYTTLNNNNNTGIGIKFNTYNNNNNKVSMSSIETIITNNQNNLENSIIRFNNRNDGILTNTVTIRNDGYILCNTLMELSDLRTKNIIKKSNSIDSLNKICQINTYDFVYKNDNTKKIHKGIIAQEIYEIIPSAINIESNNEFTNLYTISNKELIGYLIDAIKELKYQIDIIQ
jgi:hypothetical protein